MSETRKKGSAVARERFKRLASIRTKEVLNRLRILGHCSNKQAYEYTPEEIDKIFNTIEKQVKTIKSKFNSHVEKKDIDFKL